MQPITVVAIIVEGKATQSLTVFFDNTPLDHTAYIVFTVLPESERDRLQEILQRHSQLQVTEAIGKDLLQSNRVYILRADEHITVTSNRITVSSHPLSRNAALHLFLGSLAKTKKYKIAIVLLDNDGSSITTGLQDIKNCGGIILSDQHGKGIQPDYLMHPADMPALLMRWTENKWLPVPLMPESEDVQQAHRQRLLKQLGRAIRAKREAQDISQEALAKLCNMQKASMSKIEAGKGNPTVFSLYRIANALGISVNDLL